MKLVAMLTIPVVAMPMRLVVAMLMLLCSWGQAASLSPRCVHFLDGVADCRLHLLLPVNHICYCTASTTTATTLATVWGGKKLSLFLLQNKTTWFSRIAGACNNTQTTIQWQCMHVFNTSTAITHNDISIKPYPTLLHAQLFLFSHEESLPWPSATTIA